MKTKLVVPILTHKELCSIYKCDLDTEDGWILVVGTYTSSEKWPWWKAFWTSICCLIQPRDTTMEKTIRIVVGLPTGLKVLPKTTPGYWWKPFVMRQALYLSIEPSVQRLIQKTHLQPITLQATQEGTRVHVWFLSKASNSRFIASRHLGSLTAEL